MSRVPEGYSNQRQNIRYPPQDTTESLYEERFRARSSAAANYRDQGDPRLIPPLGDLSHRAASAGPKCEPSEVDRRARDAIAIIQLRILREVCFVCFVQFYLIISNNKFSFWVLWYQ